MVSSNELPSTQPKGNNQMKIKIKLSPAAGASVGIFFICFYLLTIALVISSLTLTVYGLYLAFSASIIIGICALLLEPSPLIIALIYLNYNIPQEIIKALS